MTPAEWSAESNPWALIDLARGRLTERKAKLFACAVCRFMLRLVPDAKLSAAVGRAERWADSDGSPADLAECTGAGPGEPYRFASQAVQAFAGWDERIEQGRVGRWGARPYRYQPGQALEMAMTNVVRPALQASKQARFDRVHPVVRESTPVEVISAEHNRVVVALLRDVLGNPFRPVAIHPGWLTSAVVGVAAAVYADAAFDRLPILADALQDAGCEDATVLDHCRGGGPHARGCWVVDLVLGKT